MIWLGYVIGVVLACVGIICIGERRMVVGFVSFAVAVCLIIVTLESMGTHHG